jgi:hypothetical protein
MSGSGRDQIIRGKVGLLEVAKQLGNVSQACKMMGYSSPASIFKELYEQCGEPALQEISRRLRECRLRYSAAGRGG